MELWQIGALLGNDLLPAPVEDEAPEDLTVRVVREREALKARVEAAAKGAVVQERTEPGTDITAQIMRDMGIVTK